MRKTNKEKQQDTYKTEDPNKSEIYEIYCGFKGVPDFAKQELYGCKTDLEFAKKFNIANSTLSRWKNVPDFYEKVMEYMYKFGTLKTPNVMGGLYKSCLNGNVYAIQEWTKWINKIPTTITDIQSKGQKIEAPIPFNVEEESQRAERLIERYNKNKKRNIK